MATTPAPKKKTDPADANKDGKVSQEELPEQFRDKFQFIDSSGDGFVSEEELAFVLKLIKGNKKD